MKNKLKNLSSHSYSEFEKVFFNWIKQKRSFKEEDTSQEGPSSSKITLVEGHDIVSNEEEIANIMNDYFMNTYSDFEKVFFNWIKQKRSFKEEDTSQQGPSSSKITLVEGHDIVSNEEEIANIMNDYFMNITRTLNLNKDFGASNDDPSEFESHISIKMIHEKYPEIIPDSFNFKLVSDDNVKKEIENLNMKNSPTHGSISASISKQCVDAYLSQLANSINYSFQHS